MQRVLAEADPQLHSTFLLTVLRLSLSLTSCGSMNWVQRKIHLYNVTFGLYMLDWWERCTFNILVIVLMCFVVRYITQFVKRYVFLL
ncbi:uncharacterized protein LOC131602942 [Vicia villosa]|uniref:uncharacterized protein LOC131602942 n=1 Tax=Vicia villosa TaxID=3911 RepID=UPI00273B554A|nr:uncharacterized protein LOC131602942 [Vicia villosa]